MVHTFLWMIILLALPLGNAAAQSKTPVWPLDFRPILTSSFGEFRETHLHAGIDLATGGRTGVKCFAVGDGYVARMRMSPFGYGKVLYVRLDSGPLVVYAHLERFAPAMAERARQEQVRRKRYTFDVYLEPDEIRLRQGEVIAWSGDTGVGFPHLHFEMRDGDVARNPQTSGFAVPDDKPPTIQAVSIMPLDAEAHVDGRHETFVMATSGTRTMTEPLRLGGSIGFAVRTQDRAAAGPYRQAPYRYEVRVDGRLLYRARHERFDYAHNHHIILEYDQEKLVREGVRFFQLFSRPGNRLPGREPSQAGAGVLRAALPPEARVERSLENEFEIPPGVHDVEIEVADVAGQVESVQFRIWASAKPGIHSLFARQAQQGYEILCRAQDPDGDSLRVEIDASLDQGQTWIGVGELVRESPEQWSGHLRTAQTSSLLLRARAVDGSGLEALRTWAFTAAGPAAQASGEFKLELETEWRGGFLYVDLESEVDLTGLPWLWLQDADGSRRRVRGLVQTGERAYRWQRAVGTLGDAPEVLEIEAHAIDGRMVRLREELHARIVRRGQVTHVDDLIPRWRLEFGERTLFEDVAVRMRDFDPQRLALGPELQAIGPGIEVESRAAAFDRSVRVRFEPEDAARVAATSAGPPGHGRGLFYVDRSGNLRFLTADQDDHGALVGHARSLTVFVVLADLTPPRVEGFAKRSRRQRPLQLEFYVEDRGSDLGDDAIQVEIDGQFAIPEWDPETGRVLVHPVAPLGVGSHRMDVRVVDRVGNESRQSWMFETP